MRQETGEPTASSSQQLLAPARWKAGEERNKEARLFLESGIWVLGPVPVAGAAQGSTHGGSERAFLRRRFIAGEYGS